ncbi:DUF2442 domain-containing protein [Caballeronia sp. SBC2]|uniref:DUF2442 domain-containing protein n=1 Tax=Caballeronia sp. SBC2 TaxID=2705547 RepID=UPI0013E172BF|nr:DUF2442 domain-containing protein [Caballeronia sp. SBC2]QIE22870.1 hypothetical protein SBC2_08830 [Caballeronia sp. SBC2]
MSARAIGVSFDETGFTVHLDNGSALRVPLDWFPRLRAATSEQRRDVRISASDAGLHWDQLNEDIGIIGLLRDSDEQLIQARLKSVSRAVKIDLDDL